ncbi:hypothetical protein [Neobacillus kokaensis]|uniref:Uncharacterized protein n=1 Tax=Neobacillus kokaensis TaxID=2759023 RepID=A0ABQ3MZ34_9BACI|nr:hypothetical protein [Neobacillus kokaensis]GHH96870.1 hypothetical protein AM1BK_04130 [Neobacillus kokaensis]
MRNDNNDQNKGNTINQDAVMNLANNLFKNESSFDISSIMRMATNLLSNDALMNSVQAISQPNTAASHSNNVMGIPDQSHSAGNQTEETGKTFPENNLVDQLAKLAASAVSAEDVAMQPGPESNEINQTTNIAADNSTTAPNRSEYFIISSQLEQITKDILDIKNELQALKKEDLLDKVNKKAGKKQKKKK